MLNRSLRRKTKEILSGNNDLEEALFPMPDEVMDTWSMAKDGKLWLPNSWRNIDKEMRK